MILNLSVYVYLRVYMSITTPISRLGKMLCENEFNVCVCVFMSILI